MIQQGVVNAFIHLVVDVFLWFHAIKVNCQYKDMSQSFSNQISWVCVCVFKGEELHAPILSQLFSISFLCLKYMGQTWPSNRPAGSGTVYVLVL